MRGLLPISNALSPLDTLVSAFNLGTAYGRVIAYTAIYEGTHFATLQSTKLFRVEETACKHFMSSNMAYRILTLTEHKVTPRHDVADALSAQRYPIPSATVMFLKPDHIDALLQAILKEARKSFVLFRFAWRHKLAGVSEGFLTKDSLWDRLVFDNARAKVIGEAAGTLRGVVVSGGMFFCIALTPFFLTGIHPPIYISTGPIPAASLTPARIAFSTPFVNAFTHPLVAGPVLASHPLDLQDFSTPLTASPDEPPVPVGPPSINVEARLVGVSDEVIENGGDPEGVLMVRGPSVGRLAPMEDYVDVQGSNGGNETEEDGWIGTGVKATMLKNGALRIVSYQ